MAGQYVKRLEARDDVSRVSPGVFGETASKDRVYFVESLSGDARTVQNVFVASSRDNRIGVSMSRGGHVEVAENGDRFLVLEKGRRYEGVPGEADFRVTEFDRYAARIETKEAAEPALTPKTMSTWALIANPISVHLGELVWRIGIPVSSLVLAFLAIPMSFVNPRAGRSVNLLFAVFTYIVYNNLLSVSQARVSQGRLDFSVGCFMVHAGMVLLLIFMFAQRMQLIRMRLGK
jgi:lipopolysaccharide export system permease protein